MKNKKYKNKDFKRTGIKKSSKVKEYIFIKVQE